MDAFSDYKVRRELTTVQLKQKICTSAVENFNFIEKMLTMIPHLILWLLFNQCILAKTDCDWLRIIYSKMGGNVNSVPQDCCRMDGVRCTQDGYVKNLFLDSRGLTGSIPQELGNIVNLQKL